LAKSKFFFSIIFMLFAVFSLAIALSLAHASISVNDVSSFSFQSLITAFQQHHLTKVSWLITHKLPITFLLFFALTLIVAILIGFDLHFRKRILQKLPLNYKVSGAILYKDISKEIFIIRFLFIVGLVTLLLFLMLTYQTYANQNLVKIFAVGLFVLNLVGAFLFGSLKRTSQVERLINKLQRQVQHKEEVQEKLLQVEKRMQHQSASLANLAATQLNQQVMPKVFFRQMIKQSAETLDVARVSVWLYSSDKKTLRCEALYELATQDYSNGTELDSKSLPNYFAALNQQRVVAVDNVYTHAATQEFVADYMPRHGVGALLDATIWQDNQIIGVVCHEHVGASRIWTVDEKNYAGSLADLARLTLELHKRKQAEGDLLQHQEDLEDIVQRRIASIEHNAKLFRFLVERAPVTILYMNEANEILEMNPEAEKISGYSREFAIGKTYEELFSNDITKQRNQKIRQKIALGHAIQGDELLIKCADGSTIDLSVSRTMELDDEGNPVIISIGQDMSKQKALEASLVKAREAAESADRIKSMFVASMSHELRTPLNSIIGFLGVVLQGMSGELNLKQKDQLGRAYHSAKHLLSLISDVIDISKIEAGFLMVYAEKFELAPLLTDVEHAVHHILEEKHLDFRISINGEISLETDRKRLYQVVLNVVSNAVKYTEKGSVAVHASMKNNALVIEVKDTGIGMDKAGLAKIFKPFERVESRLKIKTLGTGLGLYLTQKILTQLLGGDVTVESELDIGSTFTIIVPVKLPDSIMQTNGSNAEASHLEETKQ
jgi:PAS domain S-box-containing protein